MTFNWKYAAVAGGSVLATLAAGGIAFAAMKPTDNGFGRFGNNDTNADGMISKAEWTAGAATGFTNLDANGDGKLSWNEMPRPPRHGPRHRDRDDRGPRWDRDDAGAPPAPPADASVAAPATQPN